MEAVVALKKKNLFWLILSVCVVLLDQISKYLVITSGLFEHFWYLLPFLNLTLAHNTGAAFSFLSQSGVPAIWFFSITAMVMSAVLCIWLYRIAEHERWLAASLALIIGGAIGNLYDRLSYGYVIDFIHFHVGNWSWPIFNIADMAISIGAIMLILDIFKEKKK